MQAELVEIRRGLESAMFITYLTATALAIKDADDGVKASGVLCRYVSDKKRRQIKRLDLLATYLASAS